MQNYVIPELFHRNAQNDIIWMQDGVPKHITKYVHRVLEQYFCNRMILRHFPFPWSLL